MARLLSAPLLGWSIITGYWWLAVVTMCAAIASDVFDGKLARLQNTASAFGGFFDHATDAIFVSTGAWALAATQLINPWLWPLIGLAFMQYTLDSNSLRGQQLRTSKLGKYNGIGYYALISTAIGCQALASLYTSSQTNVPLLDQLLTLLHSAVAAAAWCLLASTVASMLDRLRHIVTYRANKL
jgi:phosphatidylglycerophosphate synthase